MIEQLPVVMPHNSQSCDYSYHTTENMLPHHKDYHTDVNLGISTSVVMACKYCSRTLTTAGRLLRHEQQYCLMNPKSPFYRTRRFLCQTCNTSFKHQRHYVSHVRHECGKSFGCPYCKRILGSMVAMRLHLIKSCKVKKSIVVKQEK